MDMVLLSTADHQHKTARQIAGTHQLLEKLNRLVSSLSDAENGKRGYVLSGQDRYLGHHQRAIENVEGILLDLRRNSPTNISRQLWEQLEPIVRKRLEVFQLSISDSKQ